MEKDRNEFPIAVTGVIGATEAEVQDRIKAIIARVTPYIGADRAEAFRAQNLSGDALAVGTPEQVVERLTDMKKRGMTYAIHNFPESAYDRSGVELFEREVIPALA